MWRGLDRLLDLAEFVLLVWARVLLPKGGTEFYSQ